MTRKDFAIVADVLVDIEDPWARNSAITQACLRLGQAYPRFDSNKFRKHIAKLEEKRHPTQ
jgi:hypothetical protein